MMASKYFVGIDVGTNETKGILINEAGQEVTAASTTHGVENPKPNYFEHDADEVWYKDICMISHKLLDQSKINSEDIKCIGISALSSDCLPVDLHGKPLRKAILYGIDARAISECQELTEKWGEDKVLELFGRPLGSSDVVPKILWIKNNEPEVYNKTHKFLTASSYITYKLTGNYTIDNFLGLASFNPLYNRDGSMNEQYAEGICTGSQLAELKKTTDIAGYMTKEAAKETGFAEGTAVITGGDDSGAEAISSGVMTPGDMLIQMGSTVYMILCTDKLYDDSRLWREEFIVPNTYDVSAGTNTSGALTKWIRDTLYPDKVQEQNLGGINAYQAMMEDLREVSIGSEGIVVLPYFAGERTPINDAHAKGMIFGLNLAHTRKHIMRAAYESVCYSIKHHFEIFKELRIPIRQIMVTGGGTKNKYWIQMLSDVLGLQLQTPSVTIGASYGDALMAMIGVNHIKDFPEAKKLIGAGKVYYPNLENTRQYEPYYNIYIELYKQNKDLMATLDQIYEHYQK